MGSSNSEVEKFDAVVRTLLSVSHEEIQKRERNGNETSAEKAG